MKQVIVEMPDATMNALERAARRKSKKPEDLVREQVRTMLTVDMVRKINNWRPVSSRLKAAIKAAATATPGPVSPGMAAKNYYVSKHLKGKLSLKRRIQSYSGGLTVVTFEPCHVDAGNVVDSHAPPQPVSAKDTERTAARARRLEILRRTSGIMKDDPDFPKDGLKYQLEARTEWD